MFKFCATFLVCGIYATSVSAKTSYECTFNVGSRSNLPDRVQVEYDPAARKAMVLDPFINHYVGEPMEAEVQKDNDQRVTLVWRLDMISAKGGGTIMQDSTRLTILKSNLDATISYSQGVGDGESGFGKCAVQ